MTAGPIPLAGVIGSPIAHSKSPALHMHWLRANHIRGHYIPMEVEAADLKTVLRTLPKMGFVGVNVTIPYKEAVLEHAHIVTDRAALIGAANTLIFRPDRKIHADNTDGYGFIENLRQGAPGWRADAGPAAVLGAGGAARAVVTALLESGAPEVRIVNRTKPRAEALRADFGPRVVVQDWAQSTRILDGAALLVNCTSLGMVGKGELKLSLDALSPDAVVTDLVYAPLKTPLLEAAEAMGCRTVDGLGMLLHQAVPAFERWFGFRPTVDDQTRAAVLVP
jgi:shikimate dehydrogenase